MTRRLEIVGGREPRAETIWRRLEADAAPAYFLSWGWIENWLACLPPERTPELAVISDGGAPIAACFLGHRHTVRHHVVPSDGLYLNTTGEPRLDELCIEHNGLLRARGATVSLDHLIALLAPADWTELFLPAIDFSERPAPGRHYRVVVDREVVSPFVDLARVRAEPGGYPAVLGSATRAQLRRAQRGAGPLRVELATDVDHALDIYTELAALHGAHWRAHGQPGAFADPWFDRFHRRLIAERHRHGEIQLLRVSATTATAGAVTLGCLYNFVAHGRVLFYQSGLAELADPRIKPGYLCHAIAIDHAARAGHAAYDLLGGDARYKRALSTDEVRLLWIRIQRPLARFALEERIRAWRHPVGRDPG